MYVTTRLLDWIKKVWGLFDIIEKILLLFTIVTGIATIIICLLPLLNWMIIDKSWIIISVYEFGVVSIILIYKCGV